MSINREVPFNEQLAVAAAVWNSFAMVREDAEKDERAARERLKEAQKNESEAYQRFYDLARKDTLEPVNFRG